MISSFQNPLSHDSNYIFVLLACHDSLHSPHLGNPEKHVFHYKHVLLKKRGTILISYIYTYSLPHILPAILILSSLLTLKITVVNSPDGSCLRIQHVYVRPLEGRLRILLEGAMMNLNLKFKVWTYCIGIGDPKTPSPWLRYTQWCRTTNSGDLGLHQCCTGCLVTGDHASHVIIKQKWHNSQVNET